MPANTPLYGFPYPLPTEPVAEGAQAIRNLAEKLETSQMFARLYDNRLAAQGEWTISGISQAYKHLFLVVSGRSAAAGVTDSIHLRYNGDQTANYYEQLFQASGTATGAALSGLAGSGASAAIAATGGEAGGATIWIPDYTNTARFKYLLSLSAGLAQGGGVLQIRSMIWKNTAAISAIQIFAGLTPFQFGAGARVTLYGLG